MIILSMDIGTTNTKMLLYDSLKKEYIKEKKVKTLDFKEVVKDAINQGKSVPFNVEKIIATGTGSIKLPDEYDHIPIIKVKEFDAIGTGGLCYANEKEALIVSVGTGTAMVYANETTCTYIGGTALGGGTFTGILKRILSNKDASFDELVAEASKGKTENVDILIKDVCNENIENLNENDTVSNVGALLKPYTQNDFAAGIANMIFENIVIIASLHKKILNKPNLLIVYTGSIVGDAYIQGLIQKTSNFTKDKFAITDDSSFVMTKGALKYYLKYNA